MVWPRANLVAPVGPPPRCHNRRSAGCTPVAFPVGCCLGRRGGETLHCCRLPRHRLTSGAATQLHYCADLLCCACRCRYCLLSHCSSAPLSYGSATAAHCRAASYIAATPRRAAPAAAPRRSAAAASLRCGRVAQLLSYSPPNRFATAAPLLYTAALLRSAPLRVTLLHAASSAPRRLAAAALLRCCRAASLLPLHSASSSLEPIAVGLGAFQNMLANRSSQSNSSVLSFWQPLQALWLSPRSSWTHCLSVFTFSKLFSLFFVLSLLSSPLPSFALLSYPLLSCLLLSSPLSCLESKTTLCFVSFG